MGKQKVTGIGGIFFKSANPGGLQDWYADKLGINPEWEHGHAFQWKEIEEPNRDAMTVWSIMPDTTKYMSPSNSDFMINYRVEDLNKMLDELREAGVKVEEKIEESEFGKFGWIYDPDGNRIELWQPPE